MRSFLLKCTALLCLLAQGHSSPTAPWPRNGNHQVSCLPGLNGSLPAKHYAGYLPSLNKTHLYFWFFESQSSTPQTDPLVLWLNGGPGCSSVFGALLETGPYRLHTNGTLTANPYSWNANANLLFFESPAGVGFSYQEGVPPEYDYATDDKKTARVNFEALLAFYRTFPRYKSNDLFLSGESYAGIYLSTLAKYILKPRFKLNLKGLLLGNAALDQRYTSNSRLPFAYQHKLINESAWMSLKEACCPFNSTSLRECGFWNATITDLKKVHPSECQIVYLLTQMAILDYPRNVYNYKENCNERSDGNICVDATDKALAQWLNRGDVQKALHIRLPQRNASQVYTWSECNTRIFSSYTQNIESSQNYFKFLLKKKVKVHLYYGNLDLACSYISGQWFIEDLHLTAIKRSNSKVLSQLERSGNITVQRYKEGLTYVIVKNAGHEVLRTNPQIVWQMFSDFLSPIK